MGMSWKSLELLRNNLGEIGGGVTSYLHNVQAENDRQADLDALKQFAQTPEGQKISPGLMSLAGSRAGQRVLPQLQGVMGMQRETAPTTQFEQPGTVPVTRNPISGETTVGQSLPGTRGVSAEQQQKDAYVDLSAARRKNPRMTFTPEQQHILDRGDEAHTQTIEENSAKAAAVGGINNQFQQQRTNQVSTQKRRSAANAATETGKQFGPTDTLIGRLNWRQTLPIDDKQIEPPTIPYTDETGKTTQITNPWGGTKSRLHPVLDAPFIQGERTRLETRKNQLQNEHNKQKAAAAEPEGLNSLGDDGWQQHSSGLLYRNMPQTS